MLHDDCRRDELGVSELSHIPSDWELLGTQRSCKTVKVLSWWFNGDSAIRVLKYIFLIGRLEDESELKP